MVGQNFGKRLVKEFQRGGKKSIVLALLLLGGLSIWTPMLWRKVAPARETASTAAAAKNSSQQSQSAVQQTTAISTSSLPTIEWKSLYRRLEKSPLVQPLALDELVRDPFEHEWVREKSEPEPKPVDDSLRSLVLSAVLSGGEGGAAVINDIVYRIGQEVPENGAIRYVLKDIRKDRVLLDRAGKLQELLLKDAALEPSERLEQDR